jgi:hypothetical protein
MDEFECMWIAAEQGGCVPICAAGSKRLAMHMQDGACIVWHIVRGGVIIANAECLYGKGPVARGKLTNSRALLDLVVRMYVACTDGWRIV